MTETFPAFLTPALVERAFDCITEFIEKILNDKTLAVRSALHVVVLDPETGEVVGQRSFGSLSRKEWPRSYDEIALAKAQESWRTAMDTGEMRLLPHLLRKGAVRHRGGVNQLGIPIGTSGVQSHLDEMIGRMVGDLCAGLCAHDFTKVDNNDAPDYV